MATLENLSKADIQKVVNQNSLKRARGYVAGGVRRAVRHGRTLRAEVGKSRYYNVETDVLDSGIVATCSCPYSFGGYCKHIGALLLKWIEQPSSFVIDAATTAVSESVIETYIVAPPKTAAPRETPYWVQYSHAEREEGYTSHLRQCLGEYTVKVLRQIAKNNSWPIKGTRKADLVEQLLQHLLQPGVGLKGWLSLDEEHRQVIEAMGLLSPTLQGKTEYVAPLAQHFGPLKKHKNVSTYMTDLCEVGLALSAHTDDHYWNSIAFIPFSIQRILPPLLANRIAPTTLSDDMNSSVIRGQARPFLQRAQQILRLLEQSQPPLRPPMPRPRLEKFHHLLRGWDYIPEEVRDAQKEHKFNTPDPKFSLTVPPPQPVLLDKMIQRLAPIAGGETQLDFIYHVLVGAGVLQSGSPVTVWPEGKRQFLRYDEAGQWALLVRSYISLLTWSEVWLMVAERPSRQLKRAQNRYGRPMRPHTMYEQLAMMRTQVVQTLAQLPDDSWFAVDDIAALLRCVWPRFDSWIWAQTQYRGDTRPDWFLTENGRALDPTTKKADWDKSVGSFIRQVIQGPLHWLGVADICLENGRLTTFRLHGLRDLYLDKVESVPFYISAVTRVKSDIALAEAMTIKETTIVVDPSAVSAQAHHYLDTISVLEESDAKRFVYQLSAAAIHQAFESGATLVDMLDGWAEWLPIPMPATIRDQLTAWDSAYGQVRLYEDVTVIELGDEYALRELKAVTSLKKYIIAEISPSLVIILAQHVDLLVAELEKAGYTPKQTDAV